MIQRKMRDQPPLQAAAQRRTHGLRLACEDIGRAPGDAFRLQFAELAGQLQTRRLVAVGARDAQTSASRPEEAPD